MSFRQCRTLCQMLRSLNYTRIISLENFTKPNFQLVADILYWLAQRYDPQSDISDDINQQKDRVQFMKSIVNLFAVKARIKLNPKKLYQADSQAVAELIKITSLLYKASTAKGTQQQQASAFTLPLKVSNLKSHKILANQICDLGVRLSDSISKQPELRSARNLALQFLQGMNDSNQTNDQAYIQNSIKRIMKEQQQSTSQMMKYVGNMQNQQKNLQEKLKKKSGQLQRAEKRFKNLVTVKPAFMEEYERLQEQLARLQQIYVNKYRNLDYLENQLQLFNKIQEQKLRKAKKAMDKIRVQFEKQKIDDCKAEDQLDQGLLEPQQERTFTRNKNRDGGNNKLSSHQQHERQQQDSDQQQGQGQQSGQQLQDQDDQDDDDSDF